MVRLIDSLVTGLLALSALFVGFMALFEGRILPSAFLAALGCWTVHALWRRFGLALRRRLKANRRRYIQNTLENWAAMSEEELLKAVSALIGRHHGAVGPLVLLPCAPSSRALNADKLIACRRAHPLEDGLCVAALCPAERSAWDWAQRLKITLLDGKQLASWLWEECPAVPADFLNRKKRRISLKTCDALWKHISPQRSGLYAVLALLLYMTRGGWMALSAFVLLLVLAGLGLWQKIASAR